MNSKTECPISINEFHQVENYFTQNFLHRHSQVLKDLIDEQDEAVFADSAYQSESSDELLIENDCQNFILFKARRGHPLTAEEVATNKLRSRIRVRCEHIFGRMSQMALDRLRSIGMTRANQHIGWSNLVYNMDRYAFLCK